MLVTESTVDVGLQESGPVTVTCAPVMPLSSTLEGIPPGSLQDVGRQTVDGDFRQGATSVDVKIVESNGQLSSNPDLEKIYIPPPAP